MKKKSINKYNRIPSISTLIVKLIIPTSCFFIYGCASTPEYTPPDVVESSKLKSPEPESKSLASNTPQRHTKQRNSGGGYYLDDGPGDNPPSDLHLIPNAVPKLEPLRSANMRPYEAMGKTFEPMTMLEPYEESGSASWYGRRYHGNPTASGEIYDMYAMTAAHPTLPLPCYARVTSVDNGKTVIVRVNDRGPFLSDRLIDLSYTAAYKLDLIDNGSGEVTVELILPEEINQLTSSPLTVQEKSNLHDENETYLQLGAFGAADSAYNYLSSIQEKLPWLGDAIRIVEQDGLFKIHAGPYPSQISARQAANVINQQLAISPLIITDSSRYRNLTSP